MTHDGDAAHKRFEALLALHKYFLNADYLRDLFMRRIKREQLPTGVDPATALDDQVAMSLWYSTVYVVIEGWRDVGLSDPQVDELVGDERADRLRVFRNQTFHYQRAYDNHRLREFLGEGEDEAVEAAQWIQRTHIALGRAIRVALEEHTGRSGSGRGVGRSVARGDGAATSVGSAN